MVSSEITNMKQILYSVWLPVWVRWANAANLGLTTANQQKDKVLLAGLHTSNKKTRHFCSYIHLRTSE